MSSSLKLTLLALVSTAAAVPHYGHIKYHTPSAGYRTPGAQQPRYPTGGWLPSNATTAFPTGTAVVPDDKTTTIDETYTSTTTIVSTIYLDASPLPEQSSQPEIPSSALPSHASSASSACGPETIYVTATNQLTVTVTAGEVVPSSPAAAPTAGYQAPPPPPPPASESPASSAAAPTGGYQAPPAPTPDAPATSTVEEGKVSVSLPNKGVENPTTSEQAYQPVETPSPAPPSGGNVAKVGLAYNDAALCKNFAGKASWAYSWSSSPMGDLPEGIKFVPLPWVKNESPSQWLQKVDEAVAAGSDAVMGFNEVDHPTQANMDPSTACQRWSEYMDPIKSAHPGVTIVGPSVTNAGDKPNWGLDWYKNFMAVCPGAKWDAVNVHFYDIFQEGEGDASTVNRFISHIEAAAKLTGKPVWVTEFGLNAGSTAEDSAKFLRAAMKYMDDSDKVHAYSYFMVGSGENQLISGNSLSPIGEVYAASS
ncbi:uncharacterized protein EI97DRAFT_435644 [Westerdykella ornata]|uniref:Asl1-like glycosyl hydrolase catalytic domain-containing protein n=1 Tax=Westerdykella ornata TaxID=318751 RepID=A0A6A6JCP8_WESOR|nr:uncharacterized protein EI97DRAFT_435644 [Westerdykella ornata]KAF2273994.1 hypothetical protein EI97DRAFT_435644 [Westerdykella ornata]